VLENRRILLIIGGGIAAYKSLDLIRRLKREGAEVTGVLTSGGAEFVTALSVANLTGAEAHSNLFDAAGEGRMGHIELSRAADLIVVAPATANLMARMVHGQADDLASTLLLATDTAVLIAPAMNVRMWQHPATKRNLDQLIRDGVMVCGPDEGDMACGEYGFGRMSEPAAIVAACIDYFEQAAHKPLAGKTVAVTAGPTHEPIDPVRYIANRSSGKQGYAIADAAARLGARTILISGPTSLPTPPGVVRIDVETARDMLAAVKENLPADIAICAAAVADWRVKQAATSKIKKTASGKKPLALEENPDILKYLARHKTQRPQLVIGFAAETDKVEKHGVAKRKRKGCDWLVANDVSPETGIMGGDKNRVLLITDHGVEPWPEMTKVDVANKLLARIADHLAEQMAATTAS
jgi:phosphopantothenoylcysteine decarboxylase/phosphopantothenate--cysteine ligase